MAEQSVKYIHHGVYLSSLGFKSIDFILFQFLINLRSARFNNTEMPFFYNKGFGGRRAGGNITADRHGVHRPVFRFRMCGFNCFR
ncbi:hypothetical protein N431DRAFT_195121 [Stipitochalara longipes BDJ]|nr:hypothetical protein N431DRAFT_195121 [Stipitochalara longipes BDJ]